MTWNGNKTNLNAKQKCQNLKEQCYRMRTCSLHIDTCLGIIGKTFGTICTNENHLQLHVHDLQPRKPGFYAPVDPTSLEQKLWLRLVTYHPDFAWYINFNLIIAEILGKVFVAIFNLHLKFTDKYTIAPINSLKFTTRNPSHT